MGLFYLLTLYCVLRGATAARGTVWFVTAIVCCALGMASKAVMVTAPIVVLLYDRTFLARSFRRALARRWALYLGLASTWLVLVGVGVVRGVLGTGQARVHVGFSYEGISPIEYLYTQAGVLLYYLRLSVWPHPLCLDYDWPAAGGIRDAWPAGLAVCALLLGALWASWRKYAIGFAGLWFFLILAPTSSFIPIRDVIFEHRMYLPLVAVVSVIVLAARTFLHWLFRQLRYGDGIPTVVNTVLVGLAVSGLALMTHQRNRVYDSAIGVWENVTAQYPRNHRARYNLANALLQAGRYEDAVRESEQVIQLDPDHAPAHHDKGVALDHLGRHAEAMTAYETAVRLDPQYFRSHLNIGVLRYQQGDYESAIESFRKTVDINPLASLTFYNMGNALVKLERWDEAVDAYRRVLRLEPQKTGARMKIGDIQARTGRLPEAIDTYRDALRLEPRNPDLHFRLGLMFMEVGRIDEAITAFEQTLVAKPDNPAARQALATAKARRAAANVP